ncbi:MAG: D-alanyl-D-alanine carboxypeptidase [Moorea sp. SIO1F2]|uniref:D-alanyl-D-alanine carboxypeptidase n=1 Tax=Moorena sp. SIO1F2 TaxID=2607819 RepID=UPI0013BB61D3|nr:D-alanyl-D-alanine carboxypeptidase [Moorena sp. SIO1F2]NET84055.1 D-alanyl-D-alanine carboxypeptidase [Moorena sp. SIO1F2]
MLKQLAAGILAGAFVVISVKLWRILQPINLDQAQLMAWRDTSLFSLPAEPDPSAEAIVDEFIGKWRVQGSAVKQGVWIQSGLTRLATHRGNVPIPAASITKIATSLAALQQWGPAHQFETRVSATGIVKDGVLEGDLVITGGSDPFFVWEEAIALGNSLNQLGIRRVTGNLVIIGNFTMNDQDNPEIAGGQLLQALKSSSWSWQIVRQYQSMAKGTEKPELEIAGNVVVSDTPIPKQEYLLLHKSLPLVDILREMNIYSNNDVSQMLSQAIGGAQTTARLAARSAGVPGSEIQLINGSGLGMENRISPRAACAMLMAIERFLQPYELNLRDVFPLAGRDTKGTMLDRNIPPGAVIKTGTLREVSALAGFLPTRDRGLVWFAIINGGNDILEFRTKQDQLLQRLSVEWGTLTQKSSNQTHKPLIIGDPKRIEKISSALLIENKK